MKGSAVRIRASASQDAGTFEVLEPRCPRQCKRTANGPTDWKDARSVFLLEGCRGGPHLVERCEDCCPDVVADSNDEALLQSKSVQARADEHHACVVDHVPVVQRACRREPYLDIEAVLLDERFGGLLQNCWRLHVEGEELDGV